jgi:hypothetical protein
MKRSSIVASAIPLLIPVGTAPAAGPALQRPPVHAALGTLGTF